MRSDATRDGSMLSAAAKAAKKKEKRLAAKSSDPEDSDDDVKNNGSVQQVGNPHVQKKYVGPPIVRNGLRHHKAQKVTVENGKPTDDVEPTNVNSVELTVSFGARKDLPESVTIEDQAKTAQRERVQGPTCSSGIKLKDFNTTTIGATLKKAPIAAKPMFSHAPMCKTQTTTVTRTTATPVLQTSYSSHYHDYPHHHSHSHGHGHNHNHNHGHNQNHRHSNVPVQLKEPSIERKKTREECLPECDAEARHMLRKDFLDDQVVQEGRVFFALLRLACRGELGKFEAAFDTAITHLRGLKAFNKYSLPQLKREFMHRLLRVFTHKESSENIFMLLAACWRPSGTKNETHSCSTLPDRHGYCGLMKFISSFFRPTELAKMMQVTSRRTGRSALHYAAALGNRCQVQCLLDMGCSVSGKDNLLYAPLHYAVLRGRYDLFTTLVHAGSDLSVNCGFDAPYDLSSFVIDLCPSSTLVKYTLNRRAALQLAVSNRFKVLCAQAGVKLLKVVSAVHFVRLYLPNQSNEALICPYDSPENKIDFECTMGALSIDSVATSDRKDLVIVFFPFEYTPSDTFAADHHPHITDVDLSKGALKGAKVVVQVTLSINQSPKDGAMISRSVIMSKIEDDSFKGVSAFKIGANSVSGQKLFDDAYPFCTLHVTTDQTPAVREALANTVFAVQAYVIRTFPKQMKESERSAMTKEVFEPPHAFYRQHFLVADEFVLKTGQARNSGNQTSTAKRRIKNGGGGGGNGSKTASNGSNAPIKTNNNGNNNGTKSKKD